ALEEFRRPENRRRLRDVLRAEDLVPFTGNAFVVGAFHGRPVKEAVYRPTWAEDERVDHTLAFAALMDDLAPPGERLTLSTAPGGWRAWGSGSEVENAVARGLARAARGLVGLEEETGRSVGLALEPEPGCLIDTTDGVIDFFEGPLARALGGDERARAHLGLCYDVCHQAVMHEDLDAGWDALEAAGIEVMKVQASSALEVADPRLASAREALCAFDEPVYLHQVGAPDDSGLVHLAPDLGAALAEPSTWQTRRPWRVHFHVPVFRAEAAGGLATTRPFLEHALSRLARGDVTRHLEIETYSFDVLPEAERRAGSGSDLVGALAREYEYVLSVLEAHGARRPIPTALLVVSDRAAAGVRADRTADLLRPALVRRGFDLVEVTIVPDDRDGIAAALREAAQRIDLVLTTGGTGVTARDVTPEATRDVIEVGIPGLGEEMRRQSLHETPKALGSRALGGARGRAILLNLPGRPEGAVACFGHVAAALAHLVALRRGPVADRSHGPAGG
ncbi:MAG: metabolite traffic protein EboE, partial [Planctomycetota bacterium]